MLISWEQDCLSSSCFYFWANLVWRVLNSQCSYWIYECIFFIYLSYKLIFPTHIDFSCSWDVTLKLNLSILSSYSSRIALKLEFYCLSSVNSFSFVRYLHFQLQTEFSSSLFFVSRLARLNKKLSFYSIIFLRFSSNSLFLSSKFLILCSYASISPLFLFEFYLADFSAAS